MSTLYVRSPSSPTVTLFFLSFSHILSLSLSLLPYFQHPLQRCTFQPIAYRVSACTVLESALAPLYPTTPRRQTVLLPSLSLVVPADAIDALPNDETRAESVKAKVPLPPFPPILPCCPPTKLLNHLLLVYISDDSVRVWATDFSQTRPMTALPAITIISRKEKERERQIEKKEKEQLHECFYHYRVFSFFSFFFFEDEVFEIIGIIACCCGNGKVLNLIADLIR